MTPLTMLWLPILLSAIAVFVASSLIHMVLPWHKNDYPKLPDQDKVMDALRPFNIAPGDYMVPRAADRKDMQSAEFAEKMKKGPVFMLSMWESGPITMGKTFISWFLYNVVVGIFSGYVAGRALPQGAEYLQVFRFAGVAAFLSYSVALWQLSIWYHRPWSVTIKITFDGLIYALLTAGFFGWFWPR